MLAGLFDAARDAVAVQRPQGFERLENHQRERPLPDIGFLTHLFPPEVCVRDRPSYGEGIGIMAQLVWPGNSKGDGLSVWREEVLGNQGQWRHFLRVIVTAMKKRRVNGYCLINHLDAHIGWNA